MSRRVFAFGFLVLAILLVLGLRHHSKPAVRPAPDVCSSSAAACIRIAEAGGATYGLNDFRFAPGHCIDFVSLPDHVARHFCGTYKLDWIGPGA